MLNDFFNSLDLDKEDKFMFFKNSLREKLERALVHTTDIVAIRFFEETIEFINSLEPHNYNEHKSILESKLKTCNQFYKNN